MPKVCGILIKSLASNNLKKKIICGEHFRTLCYKMNLLRTDFDVAAIFL